MRRHPSVTMVCLVCGLLLTLLLAAVALGGPYLEAGTDGRGV